MHAILSYRGKRPTHTPTNKQTGPITIHCVAASVQFDYHTTFLLLAAVYLTVLTYEVFVCVR